MESSSSPQSIPGPLVLRSTFRMISSLLSFSIDTQLYEMFVDYSTTTHPSSVQVPNVSQYHGDTFRGSRGSERVSSSDIQPVVEGSQCAQQSSNTPPPPQDDYRPSVKNPRSESPRDLSWSWDADDDNATNTFDDPMHPTFDDPMHPTFDDPMHSMPTQHRTPAKAKAPTIDLRQVRYLGAVDLTETPKQPSGKAKHTKQNRTLEKHLSDCEKFVSSSGTHTYPPFNHVKQEPGASSSDEKSRRLPVIVPVMPPPRSSRSRIIRSLSPNEDHSDEDEDQEPMGHGRAKNQMHLHSHSPKPPKRLSTKKRRSDSDGSNSDDSLPRKQKKPRLRFKDTDNDMNDSDEEDVDPYTLPHHRAVYGTGQKFTWYKTSSPQPIPHPPPVPEGLVLESGDLFVHYNESAPADQLPQVWQATPNGNQWKSVLPFKTKRPVGKGNSNYVVSIHETTKDPSWILTSSIPRMNRFLLAAGLSTSRPNRKSK